MRKLVFIGWLFLSFSAACAQKLHIMTYNIHHGADRNEVNTLDSIGYFIKSQNPDIVGLQEVDSVCTRSERIDQMKRLAEITGMHYAFVRHFPYQGGAYGLGILSKFPILKTENKKLELLKPGANGSSVGMLFSTIEVSKKKKILFVTAHYSAYDQATRESQVEQTFQYLKGYDLPVILTGDLNATPDNGIIQRLRESFVTVDPALNPTFPELEPTKTIDYIFVSKGNLKKVEKLSIPGVYYSDHRPLSVIIRMK